MKYRNLLIALILVGTMGGFAARDMTRPRKPRIIAVVGLDPSLSTEGCPGFAGLVERAWRAVRADSSNALTLLRMGDAGSALEPVLVSQGRVPYDRKLATDDPARARREQDQYFAAVRRGCEKQRRSRVSPVYLALRRAVESALSQGPSDAHRLVYFQIDLEETEHRGIRRALAQAPGSAMRLLPSPIDNSGIDTVVICGYASTLGVADRGRPTPRAYAPQRSASKADRLIEVWRSLFVDPLHVRFEPFCPTSSRSTPATSTEPPVRTRVQPATTIAIGTQVLPMS